jgi:hypothetical protein
MLEVPGVVAHRSALEARTACHGLQKVRRIGKRIALEFESGL